MRRILSTSILLLVSSIGFAQTFLTQLKIMVIPFTKDGEDIRTVLDNDITRRIAITKVKEGFDNKGYTTIDFIGKLKAARDNQIFTSDNQTDIKAKIIEISGCDIYVMTEVDSRRDNSGSSVNVILTAYEVSTGNSLSNKVGNSGKFFTDDIGKLTSKAVEKCIDDFTQTITNRFKEIEKNGQSLLVDISFSENSSYNMTSEIGSDKVALSDVLEDWFSKNTVNNSYHIQGTTNLKMILDDVKIPLKDKNNNRYTSNKYALEIFNFLKSLGLQPSKDIKGNSVYITIN